MNEIERLETENQFLRQKVAQLGEEIYKLRGEKGPLQDLDYVRNGMPSNPPIDQL